MKTKRFPTPKQLAQGIVVNCSQVPELKTAGLGSYEIKLTLTDDGEGEWAMPCARVQMRRRSAKLPWDLVGLTDNDLDLSCSPRGSMALCKWIFELHDDVVPDALEEAEKL